MHDVPAIQSITKKMCLRSVCLFLSAFPWLFTGYAADTAKKSTGTAHGKTVQHQHNKNNNNKTETNFGQDERKQCIKNRPYMYTKVDNKNAIRIVCICYICVFDSFLFVLRPLSLDFFPFSFCLSLARYVYSSASRRLDSQKFRSNSSTQSHPFHLSVCPQSSSGQSLSALLLSLLLLFPFLL